MHKNQNKIRQKFVDSIFSYKITDRITDFITCVESIRGPMNQHKYEVLEFKSNIWSCNILLSVGIDLNTFFATVLMKLQL